MGVGQPAGAERTFPSRCARSNGVFGIVSCEAIAMPGTTSYKAGSSGGSCGSSGVARGVCWPIYDFDESRFFGFDFIDDGPGDNSKPDDSWDSERELCDLESFPGRSPPGSDNGEADDDDISIGCFGK